MEPIQYKLYNENLLVDTSSVLTEVGVLLVSGVFLCVSLIYDIDFEGCMIWFCCRVKHCLGV